MLAVFRGSAQDLVAELDATVPSPGKAGTGFLRASRQVFINQPIVLADRERGPVPAMQGYTAVIAGAKLGDYITVGYGANYGRFVHDGAGGRPPKPWVRIAASRWSAIVNQSVAQAKAAVAARR